ncbi:MAG: 50S ribosomal protein L11 methyltransferase [Xanthobacteraceae bacterium]|nr:50S ribosomal protein L11 methyltransferase [Xanthobacteraceae bacterium]
MQGLFRVCAASLGPIAAIMAVGATAVIAQQQPRLDVPYVPTPQEVVDRMLQLGKVRTGEYHIDLGSGDGRIAVTSASKHGARSLGVDLNPVRIEEARANAKKANVSDRAIFELKNLFETDIGKADVVTMYLLPSVNLELRPKVLRDMWPGTRIVSHAFDMGDWTPDHRESVIGRTVYLWIVPARVEGRWAIEGSHQFTVTLQQKYQEISGTAEIGGKSVPLRDASLSGAEIGFAIDIDGMPYRFQGIVSGDRIEGRRNEWRAARAK